jgi:hypothetical protein
MRFPSLVQWLAPIVACWLFTGACGVSDQEAVAKFKQDWKLQSGKFFQTANAEKYHPKGGFYSHEVRILKDLLNEAPAGVIEAEFQRICAEDVDPEAPSMLKNDTNLDANYDSALLDAFVMRSIERRDSQHLITLLSRHCRQCVIGFAPLEYWLADGWPGGIERLFDCYSATKSPIVKKNILVCLGQAFPSLRGRFPADDEFVKEAQSWYAANSSKLDVNHMYQYLP